MTEKNKRTMEEIHKEYNNLCAKAGHTQYQIKVIGDDLKLINEQLKDLNLEAAALAASTPPAAPAAAPTEAPAAPTLTAVPDAPAEGATHA